MTIRKLILEENREESTSSVTANLEDGKTTRRYFIDKPVFLQDIPDTINWLLGGTDTPVNVLAPGKLARTLPQFDPVFTAWACRSVQGFAGVGQSQKSPARQVLAGTGNVAVANVSDYDQYRLAADFGPRPYPLLSDDKIPLVSGSDPITGKQLRWFLSDGSALGDFAYYPEWWRNCIYDPDPQNDYITSQIGQMIFQLADNTTAPGGFPFVGSPRMFLPNDIVTVDWFGVPRRYVNSKNSYIRRMRGLVNQYPWWETQDSLDYDFPAGSLLYLTYKATTYTPPVQDAVNWNASVKGPPKLINLKFIFLRTERWAVSPPTPNNANFAAVVNHHNALPWLGGLTKFGTPFVGGKKFYYATMGGVDGPPSFFSAPVPHLLFQDPDAPPAIQVPKIF